MKLEKCLREEHSKNLTLAIVEYVGASKTRFKTLMDLFLTRDYVLNQRAAWPLSYICIARPTLLLPYFPKLLEKLNEEGHHPAIKRNILRIFEDTDIPEKFQGTIIDLCFKIIPDRSQPIAVVAFAISTATKLCKPFPELRRELLLVLNQLSTYPQKPAIKSRIKRAIKDLT